MSEAFRAAMRATGIQTEENLIADGCLHRFHVEGDRPGTKNGWYVLHDDDMPLGRFGSHKLGIDQTWTSKDAKVFTPEEKILITQKMKAAQQQRDELLAKMQAECREWCKQTFLYSIEASDDHRYLQNKGVKAHGLKMFGEALIVPMRDTLGVIHGLQFINPEGQKKFKTGTVKQGNYFAIGRPTQNTLLICEGYATGASLHEATGHAVAVAFDAGNLKPVAENLLKKFPGMKLIICADNDESGVGQEKAQEAASSVCGFIAAPPAAGQDFNDLHQQEGLSAVKSIVDDAVNVADYPQRCGTVADSNFQRCPETLGCGVVADKAPLSNEGVKAHLLSEAVAKLAELPPLEYERHRKEQANNLGVRATVLDKAVKEARTTGSVDTDLPFKEIEPWPDAIHPAQLLTDIADAVRRFIVCEKEISVAVALWSAMTWFMDVVHVAPLAVITAPEKRCGKSQLLTLLGKLVCRPITASSISPAALFRAIDAWEPTLLIDEVDACMKDNEELRGIINSGHTRDSAYVIRTVGENFTPTKFSTWGPKALSGIGHVADTLMDRSIVLELRRKLSHEKVDRLRYAEPGFFENLAARLARFAIDYAEQVRQARPSLPSSLNDRAQDNWEPLLAIATVAGPEWFERATQTALSISGSESAVQSIGVELLADIQEVFEERAVDRISTADLIKALCEDDEQPWATYNRGMPIKPRQLATKLRGYDIVSKTVRINSSSTPKGFEKRQFEEAFSRYIPSSPSLSATTPQPNNGAVLSVADSYLQYPCVADKNSCELPEKLGCGVVADRKSLQIGNTMVEVTI